jgi:hypothetical protein
MSDQSAGLQSVALVLSRAELDVACGSGYCSCSRVGVGMAANQKIGSYYMSISITQFGNAIWRAARPSFVTMVFFK